MGALADGDKCQHASPVHGKESSARITAPRASAASGDLPRK
jgi:hypothetical protein